MKTKSYTRPYQKVLIALTLMFSLLSASSASLTHASPNATETDPHRELYFVTKG
jgi:hypothetical protein